LIVRVLATRFVSVPVIDPVFNLDIWWIRSDIASVFWEIARHNSSSVSFAHCICLFLEAVASFAADSAPIRLKTT
jgi:hypothetical protein